MLEHQQWLFVGVWHSHVDVRGLGAHLGRKTEGSNQVFLVRSADLVHHRLESTVRGAGSDLQHVLCVGAVPGWLS